MALPRKTKTAAGRGHGEPKRARALIVDDHPMLRRAVRETIEQHFPELEVAGEAEDEAGALELAARFEPGLAIVDLSLKAGHGLDLIKRLHEAHPALPILVFTLHDERLYAQRALRSGALGYVNKAATQREFLAAVRSVLARQVYLSPSVPERLREQPSREPLSNRELEIFEMIGRGKTTRQISELLGVSIKTVDNYRLRMKTKLGARTGAELAQLAVAHVFRSEAGR